MFKEFGFWISVLGFAVVWFFGHTLSVENYMGVMVGCLIINVAYNFGRYLGDE
jgi:hypothetical protein